MMDLIPLHFFFIVCKRVTIYAKHATGDNATTTRSPRLVQLAGVMWKEAFTHFHYFDSVKPD